MTHELTALMNTLFKSYNYADRLIKVHSTLGSHNLDTLSNARTG